MLSDSELDWSETDSDVAVTATVAVPKKAGKKFFNDLDAFFESAIDDLWKDSVEENPQQKAVKEETTAEEKKSGRKSFFSGLDALFSNTGVSGASAQEDEDSQLAEETLKRVTFLFKKDKLESLKSMAKKEKLYLRDIISRVLNQYIEEKEKSARL